MPNDEQTDVDMMDRSLLYALHQRAMAEASRPERDDVLSRSPFPMTGGIMLGSVVELYLRVRAVVTDTPLPTQQYGQQIEVHAHFPRDSDPD